jgi:ABC-type multidrug transport system ATPase subunit
MVQGCIFERIWGTIIFPMNDFGSRISLGTALIQLRSVKKRYQDKNYVKEALKGISFDISEGEVFGLLGVNGAGKTTLSNILAALHPCSEGDVLYRGNSIYTDVISYRKKIGYCPQKANLDLYLTLEENLLFAGRYHRMEDKKIQARIDVLMDQFDLHQYAKTKASVLSGGYKQRFLIARTLIHSPEFIILDEPTVGLDPHVRHQLWEGIRAMKKEGAAILLTTHYLEEAEALSDRVCIIDGGSVITLDTPANLKVCHQMNRLEDVFLKLIQVPQYAAP